MDDTDEQDEDSSMEKMTDSFSKVVTVHGSTEDSDTIESVWLKSGCKSSEDVKMVTSAPSSDTHYSASMDIRYV